MDARGDILLHGRERRPTKVTNLPPRALNEGAR
jgi:hypothetical protein